MSRNKILYVDDEVMALKYFERLISAIAPVLTASSVAEAIELLGQHSEQIAVLVTDQRMPNASGSELLRYAKEYHPSIKRILTTAYSGLDDAIDAINRGEIYRYVTKPWDLTVLRQEIKDALELSKRSVEREELLRAKLLMGEQLVGVRRIALLAVACSSLSPAHGERAMQVFLKSLQVTGCTPPRVGEKVVDDAVQMQAEVARASAAAKLMSLWQRTFQRSASPELALLEALPQVAEAYDGGILIGQKSVFTSLVDEERLDPMQPQHAAWLAWLVWRGGLASVSEIDPGRWLVKSLQEEPEQLLSPVPGDWFSSGVTALLEVPSFAR